MEGDNFPPPTWKMQLAQFISYAKIVVIMLLVASINFWPFLGFVEPPSWYRWMMEQKLYACLMIFFIANAIETQLVSTGAFEISIDNFPIWSKLESNRIPQPPELFQIIDNHFKFNAGDGGAGGPGSVEGMRDEL